MTPSGKMNGRERAKVFVPRMVHICVPRITTPPRPVLEASYGTVRTGVRFRNEKLVSQCSDIAQIESLRTGMKMPDCCAMHSRTFYSYAVIRLGFLPST
ncbi:hypothetical protein U1Q18_051157 [Sarracenia purpurea var. burkii]